MPVRKPGKFSTSVVVIRGTAERGALEDKGIQPARAV